MPAPKRRRRRFTPEFINRIDKTVVFHLLGDEELREILDIELVALQRRIWDSNRQVTFAFRVTDSARDYLLREGTDVRYGARHLKRAIDRALVRPISNLIATRQVHARRPRPGGLRGGSEGACVLSRCGRRAGGRCARGLGSAG